MGAPKGNKNAEKWDLETSIKLFEDSIEAVRSENFDFIGEVAQHMNTYRDIYTDLRDKHKECKILYKRLLQECEANCFTNGKKGNIVPSLAIVNLKSNHGWSDRTEIQNTNYNHEMQPLSSEEIEEAKKRLDDY